MTSHDHGGFPSGGSRFPPRADTPARRPVPIARAVTEMVTHIADLYQACHELFINYPLAGRPSTGSEAGCSMILMTHEGPAFFVLSLDYEKGMPVYSVGPWPAGDAAEISAEGEAPVSDTLVNALKYGVPIPRDGSLFGWTHHTLVTALVVVYADESESPVPSWSVMPLAGTQEWLWPPFAGERLFGNWFWKHYWADEVICLDDLVAGTPGAVFWVDTKATLGSDCCVVARDIKTSTEHTLQHGCYVYFQALQERKPVPSLQTLLANAGKVDLSPRYA